MYEICPCCGKPKRPKADGVVSSPPYADMIDGQGEGPGARHDPIYHNGDNAHKISSANGYGASPGNVGHMRDVGFEAAVSSPPYATGERGHPSLGSVNKDEWGADGRGIAARRGLDAEYGATAGQLANMTEGRYDTPRGDNFWSAARVIVDQTYAALRPGGYAAWVTKCFVRKGAIVPFSDQWQQLCAAVGFEPVERIAAMLVEEHGEQMDIFGGATARRKEHKSFFRRLAEKKGSPRIDHEDVIIMRKPQ